MANATLEASLRGRCPPPFFDQASFGYGGFTGGRFCAEIPQLGKDVHCCLPCPATDYLYPETFRTYYRIAEALNLVGLVCLFFLVISFIFLPAEKTRRHYLSYCLVFGVTLLALGFVVPLASKPPQCYDEITPNDMFSNLTCAFSGAFIISGGLSISVWIFIRALSMHLQIAWDYMPGTIFFYLSQFFGWSIAAGFFTATITVTGVSFRFGDVCHVNAEKSMGIFWIPLLVIAGGATVIQLMTFAYCLKVYVQNMWSEDHTETQSSMGLPSYTNSVQPMTARTVYRRVKKVLWLQWRGISVVVFILVDVIFFSVVFIYLNDASLHAADDIETAMPFLLCLMTNPNNKEVCVAKGQAMFVNEHTVVAVLMMLSVAGIQTFILLVRSAMFTGWVDFARERFGSNREFVSLDAAKASEAPPDARQFEMTKFAFPGKGSHSAVTSPAEDDKPFRWSWSEKKEDTNRDVEREYTKPKLSFSIPRAPSAAAVNQEWDPRSTHARGGLGFHPPLVESENGKHGRD